MIFVIVFNGMFVIIGNFFKIIVKSLCEDYSFGKCIIFICDGYFNK